MQVDRARADRTAARQTHLSSPESSKQRPKCQHARAHRLYKLVWSFENINVRGIDLVGAKFGRKHRRTKVFEQAPLRYKIFDVGNIVESYRFSGQQGRRQTRQRGILRPADLDLSSERSAALDQKFIHSVNSKVFLYVSAK